MGSRQRRWAGSCLGGVLAALCGAGADAGGLGGLGRWLGANWDSIQPAQVDKIVVWDATDDGVDNPVQVVATALGVFLIDDEGRITGTVDTVRSTSIEVYDPDGAGPERPRLVYVRQDVAFGNAVLIELTPGPPGQPIQPVSLGRFTSDIRDLTTADVNEDGVDDLVAVGAFEGILDSDNQIDIELKKAGALVNGQWMQLGTPPNSTVDSARTLLEPLTRGTGGTLIIGGFFTEAGGAPAAHLARWDADAQDWVAIAEGLSTGGFVTVLDVALFDADGDGDAELVACGSALA